MKVYGGMDVQIHVFTVTPGGTAFGTNWIGVWV
jgi:hypothetical protein